MYINIFREMSEEEKRKIERLQTVDGQIADLNMAVSDKIFEFEHMIQNRTGDFIPLFIFGGLEVPFVILLFMYMNVAWDISAGLAVAIASGLPIIIISLFVGFVIFAYRLWLRYSTNPKVQAKASGKGIENVVFKKKRLSKEIEAIRLRVSVLQEEKAELEEYLETKEREYQEREERR